jgi:Tfp pilus assembly protein PilV
MDVRMTALHPCGRLADLMGVMRGTARRDPTGPRGLVASEAGFALVEVMVSAVLVIVLALSTLQLLDRAQASSSATRARGVASGLAQSDQEMIRQLPISQLAGGYHPGPVTKTVDKTTYTITSTADWTRDATGVVTCSNSSGQVEYLKIKSTVTWPKMGSIKPVSMEGIVTPGVAALGVNRGALTVLLTKGDGTGSSGIVVSAAGVSATTDANGCAVLANLPSGSQTLTYSRAGYVDGDGTNAISRPITIGNGTTSQATGYYDLAGEIDVQLVDDANTAATWPVVYFFHTQRQPNLFSQTVTGGASLVKSPAVFPFPSAYRYYAGDCAGADPQNYNAAFVGSSQKVAPGVTYTNPYPMHRFTVTVNDSTGAALNGARISLAPEPTDSRMTGCTKLVENNANVTAGSGASTGKDTLAIPYGTWRVCAAAKGSNGKWVTATTIAAGASTTDDPVRSLPTGSTTTDVANLTTTLKLPAFSGGSGTQPAGNWCA